MPYQAIGYFSSGLCLLAADRQKALQQFGTAFRVLRAESQPTAQQYRYELATLAEILDFSELLSELSNDESLIEMVVPPCKPSDSSFLDWRLAAHLTCS